MAGTLFTPLAIRGMELKNRIVFPPMGIGSRALGTGRAGKTLDFWGTLAQGGAGTVMLGAVSPASLIAGENLCQSVPVGNYIDDLRRMIDVVHAGGAKFGAQLWHSDKYPSGLLGPLAPGEDWVAPSATVYRPAEKALPHMPFGENIPMRELTLSEIESIISRFGRAAAILADIGVDFVEVHLAHEHLPSQFFSPLTNRRTDAYGGNLANRMRFGIEYVQAVRSAVGDLLPVWVRFPAEDEPGSGGATLAEGLVFAAELQKAGADCLDVSVGICGKTSYSAYICPTRKMPTYARLAGAVREKVNIPVVAVGRINESDVAEEILQKGQADLVAIGRQLLCDPFWPQKVLEGRLDEITYCDCCNTWCWGIGTKGERPKGLCRKGVYLPE